MVVIVNDGLAQSAKLLNGVSTKTFQYIGLGVSNTPNESITNVALGSEINASGLQRSLASNISYAANYKSVVNHTFNASDSFGVWEVGLFNESGYTNGSMYARHVFGAVKNLAAGDSLEITFETTMSR